jgi:hypothetical protein
MTGFPSDDDIRIRAAELAEEVASGIRGGRAAEWLEEVLGSALLEVARRERERCAAVADHRVEMWEASARRMSTGAWPPSALAEARARLNEARALADALRVSVSPPREG